MGKKEETEYPKTMGQTTNNVIYAWECWDTREKDRKNTWSNSDWEFPPS